MYFEIRTNDVNMTEGLFSYDVKFLLRDNGEIKEARMTGGGASAGYGKNGHVCERYLQGFVENLSDSSEIEIAINTSEFVPLKFDVTEDMLIYGSIAEVNGIKFTAMMKKGDNSRIDLAYFNSNADPSKYIFNGYSFDLKIYAEDGSEILYKSGEQAWVNRYIPDLLNNNFSMSTIILDNPENKKIASIKTNCIGASYQSKNINDSASVEIPVPADGKTINSNIKFSFGGGKRVLITKIERKGDTLFYYIPDILAKNNSHPYSGYSKDWAKEIKRKEIVIMDPILIPYANGTGLEHNIMENAITGITDDMKTVTFRALSINADYFGVWEIKFN